MSTLPTPSMPSMPSMLSSNPMPARIAPRRRRLTYAQKSALLDAARAVLNNLEWDAEAGEMYCNYENWMYTLSRADYRTLATAINTLDQQETSR